jgi:hypothetical protein
MVALCPPHLAGLFPCLPRQSGYNRRLRVASGLLRALIRVRRVVDLIGDTEVDDNVQTTRREPGRCRGVAIELDNAQTLLDYSNND